jgi:hypothetical protein
VSTHDTGQFRLTLYIVTFLKAEKSPTTSITHLQVLAIKLHAVVPAFKRQVALPTHLITITLVSYTLTRATISNTPPCHVLVAQFKTGIPILKVTDLAQELVLVLLLAVQQIYDAHF